MSKTGLPSREKEAGEHSAHVLQNTFPLRPWKVWECAAVGVFLCVNIGLSFIRSRYFWIDAIHDASGWLLSLVLFAGMAALLWRQAPSIPDGLDALTVLGILTAPELAHAYVQLNCFEWPDVLREFKPVRWDTMLRAERHRDPKFKQIWEAIMTRTTPFERSRAWWMEELGRSEREHSVWWNEFNAPSVPSGSDSATASYSREEGK